MITERLEVNGYKLTDLSMKIGNLFHSGADVVELKFPTRCDSFVFANITEYESKRTLDMGGKITSTYPEMVSMSEADITCLLVKSKFNIKITYELVLGTSEVVMKRERLINRLEIA